MRGGGRFKGQDAGATCGINRSRDVLLVAHKGWNVETKAGDVLGGAESSVGCGRSPLYSNFMI